MPTQPNRGDVHVNAPLTQILIAFLQSNDMFVADSAFPNIPVDKQSDAFFTIPRGEFNRAQMTVRAPGSETAGIGYKVDPANTYSCIVQGLHHDVPDQVRGNEDSPLNSDRQATELLALQALIRREKDWVTKFFATSIWTTDQTGVAAAPGANQFLQWNDANSDPIVDIRKGKTRVHERTGFRPNTLVVSQSVWDVLTDHPDIIERVKFGQTPGAPAMATRNVLAQILEIDRILVAGGIQNTALEGAADSHSFIAGKNALLVYSAPSPGLMVPSGGYTFSWRGLLGAGAQGGRMKKFRMENLESDRVEVEMAYDMKLISADLGQFFATAIA